MTYSRTSPPSSISWFSRKPLIAKGHHPFSLLFLLEDPIKASSLLDLFKGGQNREGGPYFSHFFVLHLIRSIIRWRSIKTRGRACSVIRPLIPPCLLSLGSHQSLLPSCFLTLVNTSLFGLSFSSHFLLATLSHLIPPSALSSDPFHSLVIPTSESVDEHSFAHIQLSFVFWSRVSMYGLYGQVLYR